MRLLAIKPPEYFGGFLLLGMFLGILSHVFKDFFKISWGCRSVHIFSSKNTGMERTFKLLLVDDDTDTRSLYAEVFRGAGFEVREAKDGLEGLEMATAERPDVIFTGIIMPRMDGFALTEALRGNVVTASIPIAFSSHLGRQEDQQRAREMGINEFIVRDVVTPNEAVVRIQSLVSHSEYMIAFDIRALDAQKLASDLRLNPNFLCSENGGRQFALRLKVKNASTRTFDADLVCIP